MLRWGSCCLPFPWWFYCLRAWRETVLNKRFSHFQKYIYCSHYYVGERETRHSSSPTASSVHYPNYFFFSCTRPLYACFYDLVAVNKLIQTDSITCLLVLDLDIHQQLSSERITSLHPISFSATYQMNIYDAPITEAIQMIFPSSTCRSMQPYGASAFLS